jgi:hypothetical protein
MAPVPRARECRPFPHSHHTAMLFGRDPRKKAVLERAMKQVERMLRDLQDEGKDLTKLKLKKYQKTHFTNCTCPQCLEAKRRNNPHLRGIIEDGFKVYVGEGSGEE